MLEDTRNDGEGSIIDDNDSQRYGGREDDLSFADDEGRYRAD